MEESEELSSRISDLVGRGRKILPAEVAKTHDRIIKEDAPRKGYRRRSEEHKSVVHWDERRLLLRLWNS